MTDTMTSQNIDLSSWDTLYIDIVYFKITFPEFSWSYRQDKISRDFFLPYVLLYVGILRVKL
jgi:hypothetical protein